jgi:hypothetical protein
MSDAPKRLTACYQSVLRLLDTANDFASFLRSADAPDWARVQAGFTDLGAERDAIRADWSALNLFDGLQPAGVEDEGVVYESWHKAFAWTFVGPVSSVRVEHDPRSPLLVWCGDAGDVADTNAFYPDLFNWESEDLFAGATWRDGREPRGL